MKALHCISINFHYQLLCYAVTVALYLKLCSCMCADTDAEDETAHTELESLRYNETV